MLDFFATKYGWRNFELIDPGTGGSAPAPFPYGPADPKPGWNTPAPVTYNPGPPTGRSYYHAPPAPPKAKAAPDPWADIPGAVHDQARSLMEKFLTTVGWPKGLDANEWELKLAKSGINITASPFDAYQWLFDNALSGDQRTNSPWAQFGMLKDDYNSVVSKFNTTFANYTGGTLDSGTLATAIKNSWTPPQFLNFATFGNPEGTGPMLEDAQLSGSMPWLSQGQTYQATLEGFQAFEGHIPADKDTLAAWFRFGISAKQVGASRPPTASATQQVQKSSSEVR